MRTTIRCSLLALCVTAHLVLAAGLALSQDTAWHPMPSAHVSQVSACTLLPSGDLIVGAYAGYRAGVFRSSDGGRTWSLLSSFPSVYKLTSIVILSDSLFIASLGHGHPLLPERIDMHFGVWQSRDAGRHWSLLHDDPSVTTLYSVGSGLLELHNDSLHLSFDSGATWHVESTPEHRSDLRGLTLRDGRFVLYSDSLLFVTRDMRTWTRRSAPGAVINNVVASGDRSIAVTTTTLKLRTTWLTTDGGVSWDSIPGVRGVLLASNEKGIFYEERDGSTYRSLDNAASWTYCSLPGELSGTQYLLDPSNRLYAWSGGSLYGITTDTNRCSDVRPTNVAVEQLSVTGSGSVAFRAYRYWNWLTSNGGQTWYNPLPASSEKVEIEWFGSHPAWGHVVMAIYRLGGVSRMVMHSQDGKAWTAGGNVPIDPIPQVLGFDHDGRIYILSGDLLLRSSDWGNTYDKLPTTLSLAPHYQGLIGLVNGILALADSGAIRTSFDEGRTWRFMPTTSFHGRPSALACDSDRSIMACVPNEGLFESTDAGYSWIHHTAGLPSDSSITTIMYTPDGFWLCGTLHGVFRLRAGEEHWSPMSEGLEDSSITSLDLAGPGKFYAGTSMAGVYTTALPTPPEHSSVTTEEFPTPLQAWPNPATRELHLTLPEVEHTEVVLYDITGACVSRLFSGAVNTFELALSIDRTSIPPGIYYLHVQSGVKSYTTLLELQ